MKASDFADLMQSLKEAEAIQKAQQLRRAEQQKASRTPPPAQRP